MSMHFSDDGFSHVECPMRTEATLWCPPDECRRAYPDVWCKPLLCGKCTRYEDCEGNVIIGRGKRWRC